MWGNNSCSANNHDSIAGCADNAKAEVCSELAALAACMIKGIERVVPILKFELHEVEMRAHGLRQDMPPRMESISYVIKVDIDEPEHRLALLHENVKNMELYSILRHPVQICLVC